MDNSIRKMYNVYLSAHDHIALKSKPLKKGEIRNLLWPNFSPGPSFQFVFNLTSMQIEYATDSIRTILNKKPGTLILQDIFKAIHPEDRNHYASNGELTKYFMFSKIPPEDIPYYKPTTQYRVKVYSNYRLFLRQSMAIDMDTEGNIGKILVNYSDIHHITHINNRKISFIGLNGKPSFFNISSQNDINRYNFDNHHYSEKELTVLRLLSEGCSSREIANRLNISHNTVRTHRKNILTKSSKRNMIETVSSAIRNGLI